MPASFSIASAELVGLFVECILYGIYLITMGSGLRALLWDREGHWKHRINWPMLLIVLTLSLFATLDVAIGLCHDLNAFVYYTGPGGVTAVFSEISSWMNVIKAVDYVAQSFIGDAMLIYRCYVVYGRRWINIVPSLCLFLGACICGVILVVMFATLHSDALEDTAKAQPLVKAAFSFTLSQNILTTGLIAYKIWSVERVTASMRVSKRVSRLQRTLQIMIESVALYAISVTICIVRYAQNSNAFYVTSDSVVQIIGISYNLIIISIDSGQTFEATNTSSHLFMSRQKSAKRGIRRQLATLNSLSADTPAESNTRVNFGSTFHCEVLGAVKDDSQLREEIHEV